MTNALTPTPPRALSLPDDQREFLESAKAANTKRAYRAALRDFFEYCAHELNGMPPLPCSSAAVRMYITHLAKAGQRPSTIQVKLAAIGLAHRSDGYHDPTRGEDVRELMKGIRRKLGTAPDQKSPVLREDLAAMVAALPHDLRGLRDRAILLLGFAGAFRRSELADIELADVKFLTREMVILVRHSKTDQEGAGMKKRIPRLNENVELCPVRALQVWIREGGITEGPLFRAIDRWGHVKDTRMSDRDIALFVKRAAKRLGYDISDFAGHSLRAGFVTQAAHDRAPEADIQEVTGHKSIPVLRRYIRDAGLGQVRAIRRAFGEENE